MQPRFFPFSRSPSLLFRRLFFCFRARDKAEKRRKSPPLFQPRLSLSLSLTCSLLPPPTCPHRTTRRRRKHPAHDLEGETAQGENKYQQTASNKLKTLIPFLGSFVFFLFSIIETFLGEEEKKTGFFLLPRKSFPCAENPFPFFSLIPPVLLLSAPESVIE